MSHYLSIINLLRLFFHLSNQHTMTTFFTIIIVALVAFCVALLWRERELCLVAASMALGAALVADLESELVQLSIGMVFASSLLCLVQGLNECFAFE